MKEQLYISIPEPCHEDWNQMTPAEQGRHCAVCQKNVIDFTDADDKAIIDFFKNYNGTACGRFTEQQLNRPVSNIEIKPASNFLKYAAGLLLPGLMLSKVNGQKRDTVDLKEILITSYRQNVVGKVAFSTSVAGPVKIKEKDTFTIKELKPRSIDELLSGKISCLAFVKERIIKGKVVDYKNGEPLPYVSIKVVGTENGTVSCADGSFSLSILHNTNNLQFLYVGYEMVEVNVNSADTGELKIKMIPQVKGEVVVVAGYVTPKKKKKTNENRPLQKIKDTLTTFFNVTQIKAFPNPVTTGGTVYLNFGNSMPGNYQIQLLNSSGQLFYSFQKQISTPNETEKIHLNERMSAGVYVLQIIDAKKRLVQTSKIIISKK